MVCSQTDYAVGAVRGGVAGAWAEIRGRVDRDAGDRCSGCNWPSRNHILQNELTCYFGATPTMAVRTELGNRCDFGS